MSKTKDEFVLSCKQEMMKYANEKKLIISYIREHSPRVREEGVRPTAEEAKWIRKILNVAPNLTAKGYLEILKIQGMDTKKNEKELVDKFLTARSFWRSMRTPRVGCVIAFNDSETGLNVGWSLCRLKSKGLKIDSFNRWIGIHEAIKSAVPTERHIESTPTILADLIHRTETTLASHNAMQKVNGVVSSYPETPIPHTLLLPIKNMVVRAKKLYTPKDWKS